MNNKKVLIIISDYHNEITSSLKKACQDTLIAGGIDLAKQFVVSAPGAFELCGLASRAAKSHHWGAIICLGCVIKGETPHFDYICQGLAYGLTKVSIENQLPVIFGVLTTNNLSEALARSGLKKIENKSLNSKPHVENKGVECAKAALLAIESHKLIESIDL